MPSKRLAMATLLLLIALLVTTATAQIKGVNLGGWLLSEPWITPSLYDDVSAEDEWHLCAELGEDACSQLLRTHWKSFLNQSDFQAIQRAGLNVVRIPVGYWAVDVEDYEPYVQGQFSYLTRAVKWAGGLGLGVVISLHGLPGSQNGQENSGLAGDIEFASNSSTVERSLKVLSNLTKEFSQDVYGGAVKSIELANEPRTGSSLPFHDLLEYYQRGSDAVRAENPNVSINITIHGQSKLNTRPRGSLVIQLKEKHPHWSQALQATSSLLRSLVALRIGGMIMLCVAISAEGRGYRRKLTDIADPDAFQPLTSWEAHSSNANTTSLPSQNLSLDTHQYYAYYPRGHLNQDEVLKSVCEMSKQLKQKSSKSKLPPTLVGEWSLAQNSSNLPTNYQSNRTEYTSWLRLFFEAQNAAYAPNGGDQASIGWIFWTWRTENDAAAWSYRQGLVEGYIPANVSDDSLLKYKVDKHGCVKSLAGRTASVSKVLMVVVFIVAVYTYS
ncbi:hypothetical protein PRZ48_008547 [Zasmidium cellare]|uniref:Glycoside hydrolase family 5 domain-containing protein n=1 Tax=Zasmidium cellare TaxID=395010 RepID=A0ABR0EGM5_ZASCE|nr:hypothetical protein PRZ48_008547 [Zasmidium cellare]